MALTCTCAKAGQNGSYFLASGFTRRGDDQTLFEALARGESNISGLQNKTLRPHLPEQTSGRISRLLKQLRLHGLIKKAGLPLPATRSPGLLHTGWLQLPETL